MAELVHLSVLSAHYEESPYKPGKEADRRKRPTGELRGKLTAGWTFRQQLYELKV
jgi:hypothetical protein